MSRQDHQGSDDELASRVTRAVLERLGPRPGGSTASLRDAVTRAVRDLPPESASDLPHLPVLGSAAHVTTRGSSMPSPPPADPSVDYCAVCVTQEKTRASSRAILTTTGRNQPGIVARVTASIAEAGGDILDISQTLVSGFFTMIIVVDVSRLDVPFAEFKERVTRTCEQLELHTMVMHEDVMRSLQRI